MRKLLATGRLTTRLWWRTLVANPWGAVLAVSVLLILGAVTYDQLSAGVLAGGLAALNLVYLSAMLILFVGFALLDPSYFENRMLQGFPSWLPLTGRELELGLLLPGLIAAAALVAAICLLATCRLVSSLPVLAVLAAALVADCCLAGLAGYAAGRAAYRIAVLLKDEPVLHFLLQVLLLATFTALFLAYLILPMSRWGAWLQPCTALAHWALQTQGYGWAPLLTSSLILAGLSITGAIRTGGEGYANTDQPSGLLDGACSANLPPGPVAAVGYLEALRLFRDRPLLRYLGVSGCLVLLLATAVGHQWIPLHYGLTFLLLAFYLAVFLLAEIPLRSRGSDFPTQWLWSTLPLPVGTYVAGKFLAGVTFPALLLMALLGLAVLAGQITVEGGIGAGVQAFLFGWTAYAAAFVWGFIYPRRQEDVASEITQSVAYVVIAFALFRLLQAVTPDVPGSEWIVAMLFSAAALGLSFFVEERLRFGTGARRKGLAPRRRTARKVLTTVFSWCLALLILSACLSFAADMAGADSFRIAVGPVELYRFVREEEGFYGGLSAGGYLLAAAGGLLTALIFRHARRVR